jgi:hypothetical protein
MAAPDAIGEAEALSSPDHEIARLRRENANWRCRCRSLEREADELRVECGNLRRCLKALEEREACTPARRPKIPDIVIRPEPEEEPTHGAYVPDRTEA